MKGKDGKLKRPPRPHGDTGITGVTTQLLTGAKIPHRHNPTL